MLGRSFGVTGIQRYKTMPVAPGSTFLKGDFLTMDGSGRLQQTVAAAANYGAGKIVGRAEENAIEDSGALKPHVMVTICEPGTQFEVPLYHATPASAVWNPTLVGSDFELRNLAGGYPGVDIGNNTNTKCRIFDVNATDYPGYPDAVGAGTTQYPFVWVEFIGVDDLLTGAR